jgi:hypothetical protein
VSNKQTSLEQEVALRVPAAAFQGRRGPLVSLHRLAEMLTDVRTHKSNRSQAGNCAALAAAAATVS